MSKFDNYFLMENKDIPEYVLEKVNLLDDSTGISCQEIGDGNVNYVTRVVDGKGNSVIVKQAGYTLRISEDMKLSLDRNRIESEILKLEDELAPGSVPKIYYYDPIMSAFIMEDLTGYDIMRKALIEHKTFPKFVYDITTFMVNTLLLTTDVVMDHKDKKELQRRFINPELCEITEQLVYTEPYNDCRNRNNVFEPNADFVKKELYDDIKLHNEVAKLKFEFMNSAQALLHGDLHTGSIFIREDSTKVIDPEFAFFGPMGYDIGNIVANMIFAWCNGDATIEDEKEKRAYLGWVEDTIVKLVDQTVSKMKKSFNESVTDRMAKTPGFLEYYIDDILRGTAGVTGVELNRRIVGMANVADITSIADTEKRIRAERICIKVAKKYIIDRTKIKTGQEFLNVLLDTVKQF